MNETIRSISNRRSIRFFQSEQIKEIELQAILEAGMYAPTAKSQQPWHFTVVQNKEMLNQLSLAAKNILRKMNDKFFQQLAGNENFHLFFRAPTVVIISGDQKALSPAIDCALAAENIMIAAESLNIGSCWISAVSRLLDTEEGKVLIHKLGLPEDYKPMYSVALGYKGSNTTKAMPRKENSVNYIR